MKKKQFVLIIALVLSIAKVTAEGQQEGTWQTSEAERTRPLRDEDFEVRQNPDNTITIIGFRFTEREELVIPEKLYGLTVISVHPNTFDSSNNRIKRIIPSLVIPDTVTSIGGFSDIGLERLTLGKGVRIIGGGAFESNKRLTQITFPDSLTEIRRYAFKYCGLTSITFGRGLQIIESEAFQANKLTSVNLPASLKEIQHQAFFSNPIQSVSIPGGIEKSGANIFSSSSLISRATLPANVNNMTLSAFAFDTGLINFYSSQNKAAGTYVKNGPIWSRQ
jgi:hypothetical protein